MAETGKPDEDGQVECRCDNCGEYWVAHPDGNKDYCPKCEQEE